LACVACALAVLTVSRLPQAAEATFKGANGRIAYTSLVGSHHQLFTANPDGTQPRQLTHFADSDAIHPRWSPNGEDIAFIRQTGPNKQRIYVMAADGGSMRPLDRRLRGADAWLPDGKHLLVIRQLKWTIVDISGTNPRDAGIPGFGDSPCVLPDGKRVALAMTNSQGSSAIFIGHIGGGRLDRITPWQSMAGTIDCSPSGSSIVYSAPDFDAGPANVYTVKTDGTDPVRLTRNYDASGATWG
jgi:Tol biopolymer transport system component